MKILQAKHSAKKRRAHYRVAEVAFLEISRKNSQNVSRRLSHQLYDPGYRHGQRFCRASKRMLSCAALPR